MEKLDQANVQTAKDLYPVNSFGDYNGFPGMSPLLLII
jgi:hypothetical protein